MAASQTTSTSEVATRRDIDESQELQDRGIKREFRMMRVYMDKCFELVANAEDVDDRFQQVDDRFQQVDNRLQQVEVLIKNSRATSGW
jgi:stress response protein YsnF